MNMNNDRMKIESLRKELELKNNTIGRLDDLVDDLLNKIEKLKNKKTKKIAIGVKK